MKVTGPDGIPYGEDADKDYRGIATLEVKPREASNSDEKQQSVKQRDFALNLKLL